MIKLSYSLKLARTKLHSRRAMLIASVIVASLLFATLVATVIVFSGAGRSALIFVKKAGNSRYLVRTSPNIPESALGVSSNLSLKDVREIKAFEKTYYQNLQDKYKSLGLAYDKKSEIPALLPAAWASESLPEEQRVTVNFSSPVTNAFNDNRLEQYLKTAANKFSDLKNIGQEYGATGYYFVDRASNIPPLPGTRLVQNGKEDFSTSQLRAGDMSSYGYYTNAIYNSNYVFTDQRLLARYLLNPISSSLKGIPVIVSAQEAASLFGNKIGVGEEPRDASKKLAWLKDLQSKANGFTYQACYRNSAERALLEKIQQDYVDTKNTANKEERPKPNLTYEYPKEACGDIAVKSDTRTLAEKRSDAAEEEKQKKLGTYIAPRHKLLTFQIVGIKYAQPQTDYTKSAGDYLKNLLATPSLSSALDIPLQLYESLPQNLKFDDIEQQENNSALAKFAKDDLAPRVLEFSSVENARKFLDDEACTETANNCHKKFIASPYGSNYLILDEISKLFNRIISVAFPAILSTAAIIIWFTISRIIAENRKETAIYRAMGAKRFDITKIYIVYILLVASRITAVSLAVGVFAAFVISQIYEQSLTRIATAAFGVAGNAPQFSIFNLNEPLLLIIIACIFAVSLIASIQPLIRNVKRNPVQDIRDN